jgi:hypothetical protein
LGQFHDHCCLDRNPAFAKLRDDPRFEQIVKAAGIP